VIRFSRLLLIARISARRRLQSSIREANVVGVGEPAITL
jgi:hypothetical protein